MGGACFGSKKALSVHPEPPELAVVPNCVCSSSSSTATPVAVATLRVDPSIGVATAHSGANAVVEGGVAATPGAPAAPQIVNEATAVTSSSGAVVQNQPKAPSEAPSIDGKTPSTREKPKMSLVKAAKENNISAVDDLLLEGAQLEVTGMWDNTPLLVACTYGHTEVALKLIAHKANVLARNEHDATPLHYAAVEGKLSVIEAMINVVKADGSDALLQKMVKCGDAKVYNRHLDAYGRRTPLGLAAESGFVDIVSGLISLGASVETASEDGRSPLWLACRNGRTAVARLLLQHGASADAKDGQGVSVLQAATTQGSEDLVSVLLSHGVADVNDTAGSPLRDAVKSGKRSIVQALLTHGAAVHPQVLEGAKATEVAMPLHVACEKGDEYIVSLLIRVRADPSLRDLAGQTAFDLLRRRGLPDGQIVSLLSPPFSVANSDGSTGGELGDAGTADEVSA
eukprot:TRINITY_DN58401_c0_g1_i1.p1 TRINITY_DN58401_c0_g1~~TRINITY_DN58401_c0_g1_i1.p1  ORF type:complete len:456 (-),score=82.12 TRINITY_DN58401_c0_g1_i1:212-1579(-)